MGIGLLLLGLEYEALAANLDCFVITNMRVFRVNGVFARYRRRRCRWAGLDIAVIDPVHGRILGFGHFTFESAAQDQGLRDIRCASKKPRRQQPPVVIQRVVQRSGLRGPRVVDWHGARRGRDPKWQP